MDEKQVCPKCGENKIAVVKFEANGETLYQVTCWGCSHHSEPAKTEEAAIENWNKERSAQ